MVEEEKLLLRLKKRQTDAINQAIEVYTPYLNTVLYRAVGNGLPREDMEEIVADVFVMLWKNAEYIDLKKGTLRSYIAAAARNFAFKRLQKRNNHTPLDEIDLPDEGNSFDHSLESDEIWEAVMRLGEPDNEIFVRYYQYDEALKDIAKATDLNISTVKTKLSRGRQKLKKLILNDAEELL